MRDNSGKSQSTKGKTAAGREAREVFVEALTTDRGKGRIVRAARKAYPNQNHNAAQVTGSRLLRDAKVQSMIRERLDRAAQSAGIRREEVTGILRQIGGSSLTDVLNDEGELDWNLAKERGTDHLIKEVVVTVRHAKDGSSRVTRTYKMHDPLRAFDLLSDLQGWKKQPAQNPIDAGKDMYNILRSNPTFDGLSDENLRERIALQLNISPADLGDVSEAVN